MPRDLLVNATLSITGQWVRVEPARHKTWPFRIILTSDTPASPWSAGNVILEELVGGLPAGPGPLLGNPGLLTAGATPIGATASVRVLATLPAGSPDFDIDMPVEYIRARTDANIVGLVSVRDLEAE